MLVPKNPDSSVCWCLSHRLGSMTNREPVGPARGVYVKELSAAARSHPASLPTKITRLSGGRRRDEIRATVRSVYQDSPERSFAGLVGVVCVVAASTPLRDDHWSRRCVPWLVGRHASWHDDHDQHRALTPAADLGFGITPPGSVVALLSVPAPPSPRPRPVLLTRKRCRRHQRSSTCRSCARTTGHV
jgi:hypothetical protein